MQQRRRRRSSLGGPALLGPRANLGSSRARLARLGYEHLLLRSLARRLGAGGAAAAAASAVRSWRGGADAPGSSLLHFNSWPLWPLHSEREASCWSCGERGEHRCGRSCRLVEGMESSKNIVFMCSLVQRSEGRLGR